MSTVFGLIFFFFFVRLAAPVENRSGYGVIRGIVKEAVVGIVIRTRYGRQQRKEQKRLSGRNRPVARKNKQKPEKREICTHKSLRILKYTSVLDKI